MENIVLKMPKTENDCENGFNAGEIETFKNNPMWSLTKEELQNSTDGAQRVNGKPKHVTVEFSLFDLPRNNFPDIEKFTSVVESERKYWDEYLVNDKKSVEICDKILKTLKQEKIRCLRISDFNTTGLTNITGKTKSSPWKNLVKDQGVSDKPGSFGGAFGVGKNAAFANSVLRTVFYNTYNVEEECAFEGCTILASYSDGEYHYDGSGFFCNNTPDAKTDPVMKNISLEPGYTRTEYGLDKYVMGFRMDLTKEEIESNIVVSSIDNFLYAFWSEQLTVKCGDIIIDKEHLDELFEKYRDQLNKLTIDYYKTIKNPQKTVYCSIFEEDDVVIHVSLDPDAYRKAAVIRQNGMKIFDKDGFRGRVGFSAAIVLQNDKVNAYFKKLEDTKHDSWSDDRAENPKEAKQKKAVLFDTLRDIIKELRDEDFSDSMDADGLSEYLPYTYVSGKSGKKEGLSNSVEQKNKKKVVKNKNKPGTTIINKPIVETKIDGEDETTEGEERVGSGTGKGGGHNPFSSGSGETEDGGEKTSGTISKEFIRKQVIGSDKYTAKMGFGSSSYVYRCKPQENIKSGFLEVYISCDASPLSVDVVSATLNGETVLVKSNKIHFAEMKKDSIYEFSFNLKRKGNWALEVVMNENQE